MTSTKHDLCAREARYYFDYFPDTGSLVWQRPVGRGRIGARAGTLSNGYLRVQILGKLYLVHRVIWLMIHGEWPSSGLDHIDHNPMNNRFENLREADQAANTKNQTLSKRNSSGHCGVHWYKRDSKWQANIQVEGKHIHLGYFITKEEAVAARHAANTLHDFHINHGKRI